MQSHKNETYIYKMKSSLMSSDCNILNFVGSPTYGSLTYMKCIWWFIFALIGRVQEHCPGKIKLD